jgi:DNA (cytosine-5)-methyltransferase 1
VAFDLGLERAGMECRWQVEIDPFSRRVLAKHWPDVRRHDDVKTFPPTPPEGWSVDLICGGFPCQDISLVGKGAGLDGKQSGLWFEYARVVRTLRPRYVLVENVSALLVRGLDRVLGTLAEMGYDAEWGCIPAAAVGSPQIRDRVFLVAYPDGKEFQAREPSQIALANARRIHPCGSDSWACEPDVGRVAHGVPARMDRLRGLGNAVVPQVAEWIGRMIVEADR